MPLLEDSLDLPLSRVLAHVQDQIMTGTTYFGVPTNKNPMDAWVYQELLHELRPDVILEIGNKFGGSALFFAHQCDLRGHGRVIGLDINHARLHPAAKAHPRIEFLLASGAEGADLVRRRIAPGETVLVVEDSAHTYEHTLAVLRLYAPLVPPGGYFIVEDSICHHGLDIGPSPGPYEAIETFLAEAPDFESDRARERFLLTWNPKGFLRRRA